MNQRLTMPLFLAISWLGTIVNFATEAKSVFGALAALASLVASSYAIAIARTNLRKAKLEEKKASEQSHHIVPAIFLFAALAASGCASAGNPPGSSPLAKLAALPTKLLDSAARLVTTTTTNVVEQAVVTATDVVTQDTATLLFTTNTTLHTNLTLVTNITAIARPAIDKTVEVAQTVSGFLPPPYGEAAAGAFALISGLLAAAVKRRNAQLSTVIQGVEKSGNADTKKAIADLAQIKGVYESLHAFVKKQT
jgi:hypothetical protein